MPRLCKAIREELTAAMRTRIRETFARLLAQDQDGSGVTMENLAAEVGVAKGTLYLYYKTKEEIVRDSLEEGRKAVFQRMAQEIHDAMTAEEQLTVYLRIQMEDFMRNRQIRMEFVRGNPLPYSARRTSENLSVIEKILKKGMENGDFRILPVRDTARFIRCSLIGTFRQHLRSGETLDVENNMKMFQELIIRSLKNEREKGK